MYQVTTQIIPEEHYYWCLILIYFNIEVSQREQILGCDMLRNTSYLWSHNESDWIISTTET